MSFFDKWNKGTFSIYKSEEKTVLKLLEKLNIFLGEMSQGVDGKTDLYGDHKGSWQGLKKPTLSDEGMRATVEKLVEDIKYINAEYDEGNLSDFINNSKANVIIINKEIQEEEIKVTRDNITININNDINCTSFIIEGNNITINAKGKIKGNLKSFPLSKDVAQNTSTLFFNQHDFKIGDKIATSYGLGGDGKNHATVINTTPTSVLVDLQTHAKLPTGAYVGNFFWGGLLTIKGKNIIINNLWLDNANGYSIITNESNIIFNNLKITNNGLDLMLISNSDLIFNNSYFGNIVDCAKSGIVNQGSKLVCNDCTFNKDNSDGDVVLYEGGGIADMFFNRCEFFSYNSHVAPYNYNKFAIVSIQSMRNEVACYNIVFDNCTFNDTIHGLFHKENDSFRPIISNILINNCSGQTNLGEVRFFKFDKFIVDKCDFHDKFGDSVFLLNDDGKIDIVNSFFKNIKNDFPLVANISNCVFDGCYIKYGNNFILKNITFKNGTTISPIAGYENNKILSIENLIIDDVTLQQNNFSGDISATINLNIDNTILEFLFPNTNSKNYLLRHANRCYYITEFKTAYSKNPLFTKYNYIIGNEFIFNDLTGGIKKSSNANLVNILSKKNNVITVDNVSSIKVNDKINILLKNGIVKMLTVTNVDSNSLTISESFTEEVEKLACTYTL